MLFNKLFKEQVEDIALCMSVLKLNMVLFCKRLCLVGILYLCKVDAGIFLYSLDHCQPFKGLAQVDLILAVRYAGLSAHLHSNVSEHIFRQIHHSVVVGISLIKLHQSELRVMSCIDALVPENSADLVNLFKSAHDKPFKIKLKADTQLNVLIECVIMGLKGSCGCSAGIGHQHRSFDLHKAKTVKISSYGRYDL